MKVSDEAQDRTKGSFCKLREGLIDLVVGRLGEWTHREVATRVRVSEPLAGPQFSTREAVAGPLKNAFAGAISQAIPPGLD